MNQNGTAFCPHCHATNEDRRKVQQQLIQQPTHTPRTTATQSYDHERLIANGNNHADAKLYNNVIHPSLLHTEIHNHLCASPLHCLLGLVPTAIDMIREECIQLDSSVKQSYGYIHYIDEMKQSWYNVAQQNTKIMQTEQTVDSIKKSHQALNTYIQQHKGTQTQTMANNLQAIQKILDEQQALLAIMRHTLADFNKQYQQCRGPFTTHLDATIKSIGVRRTRYHGKYIYIYHMYILYFTCMLYSYCNNICIYIHIYVYMCTHRW